jgi:hypothetical protein
MIKFITLVLIVLVAGLILGFVTACAPQYLPLLFSLSLLVVGVLLVSGISRTISKGKLQGRVGVTSKHAAPFTFWFGVLVYIAWAILCFVGVIKFLTLFLENVHEA